MYIHSAEEKTISASPQATAHDGALAELLTMGFEVDLAQNALVITRGNVSEAVNLLVSNPSR